MDMLENYFFSPIRLRQLRRGPLGEHLDGLAGELRRHGYTMSTARRILPIAGRFSRFLEAEGITDVATIDERLTARFVDEELRLDGLYHGANRVLAILLAYLRGQGIMARTPIPKQEGPHDALLKEYDDHLRTVRGLADSTRYNYQRSAQIFLAWMEEHHAGRPLDGIVGHDVLAFVLDCINVSGKRSRHLGVHQLRSFLRYLHWNGTVQAHLDRAVPSVPKYRLASLPRHLPWMQVQALIDSVDTTHPEGTRDKAILLVLAGLGLRSHEVRHLEFNEARGTKREFSHYRKKWALRSQTISCTDARLWTYHKYSFVIEHRRAHSKPHQRWPLWWPVISNELESRWRQQVAEPISCVTAWQHEW
jgi:integrase/recombinase XerD